MRRYHHLRRFFPYVLLALLTALVFYKLAFTDMILARGDAYSYFYPYWDTRNRAFQNGELPLWTPDIFMGAPLLANPQLGTFYPPNWLMTWLPAPDGIRYSVLLHTFWAAAGVYVLFNAITQAIIPPNSHKKSAVPALGAAAIYAFGGAFTGHVEQINQLQGLSWLPWLFYWLHRILILQSSQPHTRTPQPSARLAKKTIYFLLLTASLALQVFSGHTQTVFIAGVGLALYALIFCITAGENQPIYPAKLKLLLAAFGWLLAAAAGAIMLTLPQLLPTLELTGMSYRGGSGFTAQQATAFSLPIRYIGRSLLPSYDGQLFTEYMATPGVIGLAFALFISLKTLTQRHSQAQTNTFYRWGIIWSFLAFVGLFFAIGRFNPLYLVLAELPGFDLFRVPARWLALFGMGVAVLAGLGVHWLITQDDTDKATAPIVGMSLILLLGLMFLTRFVFSIVPEDIFGSALPTNRTLLFWGAALAAICLIVVFRKTRVSGALALSLIVLELCAASHIMPFNDVAPREVYMGQRLTISQMQVFNAGQQPPGRILAINNLLFDIGDRRALEDRFLQLGMDEQAIHTAFTAIKKQEMLFHNLPLTWGIPSVDGMDGGVLPTIHYSQFTSLLLPAGVLRTTDGRIGELLALPECFGACIPDDKYLRMMAVRYLIRDKVPDIWHEDVAYDVAWRFTSTTERPTTLTTPQPFIATQINILYTNHTGAAAPPVVSIGQTQRLAQKAPPINLGDYWLAAYGLDTPQSLTELSVSSAIGITTFFAVTALDTRTGDFVWLTPLRVKLALSSDIKIYDYNAPHPALDETLLSRRAWVVNGALPFPDTWQGSEDALRHIQAPHFSPQTTVAIHGDIPAQTATGVIPAYPTITHYTPHRVELHVTAVPTDSYVVLADAWYPGWKATVNDENVPVYRANVMFRAVPVPAGESRVVFYFEPDLWYGGMAAGAIAWVLWGMGLCWWLRPHPAVGSAPHNQN